ncbi:MAG: DMT family transporter [Caldilineaceae bacterium]
MKIQDRLGWGLALASTFASAIVTPMARGMVTGGMNPITLVLARLLIASLLFLATLPFLDRQKIRLDRQGWLRMIVIGIVAGVEICCFFWSLAFVDASMSAMIKATQPLVVLLMLVAGGERLTGRHWFRLLLAMIGAYLLLGTTGQVSPFGLLLLALSLLLYAAQLVLTQWWLKEYDSQVATIYVTVLMTVVIVIWWWVQGIVWQPPTTNEWLIILVLAVISTWFARLTLFAAIRRIGSGQIALLWPLQTLTVIGLSVLFLNERLAFVQWLGGGLILVSALMAMERVGRGRSFSMILRHTRREE